MRSHEIGLIFFEVFFPFRIMCCWWCICILMAEKRLQQAVCKHCWTCPEDPTTSKTLLYWRENKCTLHISFLATLGFGMPSVITSADTSTKTHGEEGRDFKGERKKSTSKPWTKYCDFSHAPAMLLTFANVKPSWHLQPTQNSLHCFLPAMAFLPFSQHMFKINIWGCEEASTFQC